MALRVTFPAEQTGQKCPLKVAEEVRMELMIKRPNGSLSRQMFTLAAGMHMNLKAADLMCHRQVSGSKQHFTKNLLSTKLAKRVS